MFLGIDMNTQNAFQNSLSAYGFHFLRTIFIVGLNLFIARALLSSELFGDFRVAVKFMFVLGAALFALAPFANRFLTNFSSTIRKALYAIILLGITVLLNGSYIIGRDLVHDWAFVDYLNHHPIHILMPGVFVFVLLQVLAKMLSKTPSGIRLLSHLNVISYALFAGILAITLVLLPELSLSVIIAIFLLAQILLLAVGWSYYQYHDLAHEKTSRGAPKNLMFQSGFALSLFALELLAHDELAVTQFAIIMVLVSLLFITTLPLDNAMSRIHHWSRELTPSFAKIVWINAVFTSFMFMILMPMSRYILGWLDGGLVLDFTTNEPMLTPLRFALTAFLLIAWVRPFFSVLLRFDVKLAKRLKVFKMIILFVMLVLLIPPYHLYGALIAEVLASFSVYGFALFHLFENGAFQNKAFWRFDV